jgi:outer membrane immunogenic protein
MKTEYRVAEYGRVLLPDTNLAGVLLDSINIKPIVQTVSTQLVYRFNGPGGAMNANAAYMKAPPVAPAFNWTGFYVGGGGGYGLWTADTTTVNPVTGICVLCINQTEGGRGYFGTVGAGYDRQFNEKWVAGVFADGQFGSIRGTIQDQTPTIAGRLSNQTNWAAGVRVGYLVTPNVFSYVNGGYSGASFSGATMVDTNTAIPTGTFTPSFHRDGWFLGGGVENQLWNSNWFMKTEYRVAEYGRITLPDRNPVTGAFFDSITFKPYVQTVSTQMIYRFNWAGPVVAKY